MNSESEIASLEEPLRMAMLRGDLTALDALVADELVFGAADGSVVGKTSDLELHRCPFCGSPSHAADHRHRASVGIVRVISAILRSHTTSKATRA